MARNIEAIIFDWDGPLADSFGHTYDFQKQLCEKTGRAFPFPSHDDLRRAFIAPLSDFYEKVLNFNWTKNHEFILESYKDYMADKKVSLAKGIPGVLKRLYDMRKALGIASSNHEELIKHHLKVNGVMHYFGSDDTPIVGKESKLKEKPAPDMLLRCASILKKHSQNCLYIGDSYSDIQAAKTAGMVSVAVAWGYDLVERLEKERPDYLIDLPELIPLIASGFL